MLSDRRTFLCMNKGEYKHILFVYDVSSMPKVNISEIYSCFSMMTYLTLKHGSKVKFYTCKRFVGHDFL